MLTNEIINILVHLLTRVIFTKLCDTQSTPRTRAGSYNFCFLPILMYCLHAAYYQRKF